jgi:hypothetical protein
MMKICIYVQEEVRYIQSRYNTKSPPISIIISELYQPCMTDRAHAGAANNRTAEEQLPSRSELD